jgi:hypothetical protein
MAAPSTNSDDSTPVVVGNEKPQVFIDIQADELMTRAKDYHERGCRFVNICGSTADGGVELIYSFSDGLPLDNLRFVVSGGAEIPSVTALYPNAFFFENETHDLFGTRFLDISIDFGGRFYKLSVPTPMNPHSEQAKAAAAEVPSGLAQTDEAATGTATDAGASTGCAQTDNAGAESAADTTTPTTTKEDE